MFPGFSISLKKDNYSSDEYKLKDSEDDHYDEYEDNYSPLDDGIGVDESIIDEYDEHFEDELESDTPIFDDIDSITSTVDELEAQDYDILEEDE